MLSKFYSAAALLVVLFSMTACVSTGPAEPSPPGSVEIDRNNLPPEPARDIPSANRASRAVSNLIQ